MGHGFANFGFRFFFACAKVMGEDEEIEMGQGVMGEDEDTW